MKGNKTKLTKSQLDKLGKFSLKEKVEHATASADTAEEAAQNLKDIIQPNERGQIWSKHQTAMKGDKEAQEEHDALNKTQKGLASLLWFVENQSKKFFNSTATFGTKHTLIKGDTWKTEKQMIDQFGDDCKQSWFQGINQEVNVWKSSQQPLLKGFLTHLVPRWVLLQSLLKGTSYNDALLKRIVQACEAFSPCSKGGSILA